MAKAVQIATEMMRADAGFHADQAGGDICKSSFNLATRPFLPQNNLAALVEADHMERVLADIDANDGDLIGGRVGHGRAPSPNPALLARGAGTRPDHPISGPSQRGGRASRVAKNAEVPPGRSAAMPRLSLQTQKKRNDTIDRLISDAPRPS